MKSTMIDLKSQLTIKEQRALLKKAIRTESSLTDVLRVKGLQYDDLRYSTYGIELGFDGMEMRVEG